MLSAVKGCNNPNGKQAEEQTISISNLQGEFAQGVLSDFENTKLQYIECNRIQC